MSVRSHSRGSPAASSIRLALRTSSIVATRSASFVRWVLRWFGSRRLSSALRLSAISVMPFMMRFQGPPRAEALNHTPIRQVNNLLAELIDGKLTELKNPEILLTFYVDYIIDYLANTPEFLKAVNRGKTPGKRKLLIQWAKPRSRILSTARLYWHQSRLCRLGKTRFRSSSCFCFGVSRLSTSILPTTGKRAHNLPRISKRCQPLEGARVFAPVTFCCGSPTRIEE